jgi:hypothetical protein
VYVTPDGDDPSEDTAERWLSHTYADIHRILSRVQNTYRNAIGDDVLVFLDHYLNLLGTRFMNDEVVDELCRKIYKNHPQALELIWERIGNPESSMIGEIEGLLSHDGRWRVIHKSRSTIEFLPEAWIDWLTPVFHDVYYPFSVALRLKEGKLGYILWIGPVKEGVNRTEIITRLREECPALGFKRSKAYQVDGMWNRITSFESWLEWGDDDEPDAAVVCETVKKGLAVLYPRLEKLAAVFAPLCVASGQAGSEKEKPK